MKSAPRLKNTTSVNLVLRQKRRQMLVGALFIALLSIIVINTGNPEHIFAATHYIHSELQIKSIDPNPFNGDFNLAIHSDIAQPVMIRIYNSKSEIVIEDDSQLHAGLNKINITPGEDLLSGEYILTATSNNNKPVVTRLFKQ